MKRTFLTAIALMALSVSANAYCIRPTDGGFYNKNCITQAQADQLNQVVGKRGDVIIRDHGNSPSASKGDSSFGNNGSTITRNYAFGDQPGIGKRGTQSLPKGYTEVSRRVMSQSLARRSTLTGPAVHTDPVTGEKTLRSVEITYSTAPKSRGGGNEGRRSYNDNMGGSGRSHQGM